MALIRDWGAMHDLIDLTSDDDTIFVPPHLQSSPQSRSFHELPTTSGAERTPAVNTPSLRNNPATSRQKASPYMSPSATSSAGSSRPTSGRGIRRRAGAPPNYVHVLGYEDAEGENGHASGLEQSGKRRKLSANGKHKPEHRTKGPKPIAMRGGAPSVQSLNSAFKSHGRKTGASSDFLDSGRPLQIGRASDEDEYDDLLDSGRPLHIGRAPDEDEDLAVEPRRRLHTSTSEDHDHPLRRMSVDEEHIQRMLDVESEDAPQMDNAESPLFMDLEASQRDMSEVMDLADSQDSEARRTVTRESTIIRPSPVPAPMRRRRSSRALRNPTALEPPAFNNHNDTPAYSQPSTAAGHQTVNITISKKPLESGLNGLWTVEEDHLLIYLKEFKKANWIEIIAEYPHRSTLACLQTRYCSKWSKRNRADDPPRASSWILPREFAAEAKALIPAPLAVQQPGSSLGNEPRGGGGRLRPQEDTLSSFGSSTNEPRRGRERPRKEEEEEVTVTSFSSSARGPRRGHPGDTAEPSPARGPRRGHPGGADEPSPARGPRRGHPGGPDEPRLQEELESSVDPPPTNESHRPQGHLRLEENVPEVSVDEFPAPHPLRQHFDHVPAPSVDRESGHPLLETQVGRALEPTANGRGVASRPRRNVETVNYTWPRRQPKSRQEAEEDDSFYDDSQQLRHTPIQFSDSRAISDLSEPPSSFAPELTIPVSQPMDIDFNAEDACVATAARGQRKPYLSHAQRSVVRNGVNNGDWDQMNSRAWQGAVVHVDFSRNEMETVEAAVYKILGQPQGPQSTSLRKRLRYALRAVSEPKLARLSYEIRRKLRNRDRDSIHAFIEDARLGKLTSTPHIDRLGAVRQTRDFTSSASYHASTSSLLRQRELGLQSRRGWKTASTPLSYQLKNRVYDTFGPTCSYTGASSDIHTVAWSPDAQYFAAGAVCVTDPDSMQYNRPNNLLYGDVENKTIRELGEHSTLRGMPASGPNSTHEMYVSLDENLYHTVSAVAFSQRGEYMFSAGYDKAVMVWRTQDHEQPELIRSLSHKAEVDLLDVSCDDLLATAAKRWEKAVKVCRIREDEYVDTTTYSSRKADQRPDLKILPTALKFEPWRGQLLLAGFGANQREDRMDVNGDICLWDVETKQEYSIHGSTKNVFDVAWDPEYTTRFGVGCVAASNVNRGTRSVVRIYDVNNLDWKWGNVVEFECPALDMNDVVFCPYDSNLVAAGCTSGKTYVWDYRKPNTFLYELSHGKSLMPLDDHLDREVTDTGIRFLSWGENATRLYTASSDGVVKTWDVARSVQDVFIKDLITCDSGVMSGAFSSDKSRLVIGEVNGSVNVLEVGNDDISIKDAERLRHIPYIDLDDEEEEESASSPDLTVQVPDSGRAIAAEMIARGEIVNVQFGGFPVRQAIQGPNYDGPLDFAPDAPYLREKARQFQGGLAGTTGSKCDIAACRDNIVTVTAEDIGDSGRSGDRIPDELRKQWKLGSHPLTVVPGKSKCASCGRPARPADSSSSASSSSGAVVQTQLCERCHFSCFRCGGICRVKPGTEKLVCGTCFRVWDAGVLGYECVEDTGCGVLPEGTPGFTLVGDGDGGEGFLGDDGNVTFGDEMNALSDYYFSRAIDRPESPPL